MTRTRLFSIIGGLGLALAVCSLLLFASLRTADDDSSEEFELGPTILDVTTDEKMLLQLRRAGAVCSAGNKWYLQLGVGPEAARQEKELHNYRCSDATFLSIGSTRTFGGSPWKHDDKLLWLKMFPNLEFLSLAETDASDVTMEIAAEMPHLTILVADGMKRVTDRGAKLLVKCQQLHELDIAGTSTTSAGVDNLLAIPKLEILTVDIGVVTDAQIDEAKKRGVSLCLMGPDGKCVRYLRNH